MKDTIGIEGTIRAEKVSADGSVTELFVKNLVVQAGKNHIASRMAGTSSAPMSHIAVGSATAETTNETTGLGLETGRVSASVSVDNNVISFVSTFPAGVATGNISEMGIFNAASAGTMLSRAKIPTITKSALEVVNVYWSLAIKAI